MESVVIFSLFCEYWWHDELVASAISRWQALGEVCLISYLYFSANSNIVHAVDEWCSFVCHRCVFQACFPFDPRIFSSFVLGLTHANYQSPVTHPRCALSYIQPLQRSSTFLSSPFSPMSSTLPLPVSFLLFVSILYLSFAFSFSPLAPCLVTIVIATLPRYVTIGL